MPANQGSEVHTLFLTRTEQSSSSPNHRNPVFIPSPVIKLTRHDTPLQRFQVSKLRAAILTGIDLLCCSKLLTVLGELQRLVSIVLVATQDRCRTLGRDLGQPSENLLAACFLPAIYLPPVEDQIKEETKWKDRHASRVSCTRANTTERNRDPKM